MKRLYLLRHAKSGWDNPALADHDRTLAPRGIAAAQALATVMTENGWLPEHVICSTATRTRQTLDLIRLSLPSATSIKLELAVYTQMSRDYLTIIAGANTPASSLMVIGHNSATETTAQSLVADGSDRYAGYPTTALAVIDFAIEDWSQIAPRRGNQIAFWTPRRGILG